MELKGNLCDRFGRAKVGLSRQETRIRRLRITKAKFCIMLEFRLRI
jgi:hypothetical protein